MATPPICEEREPPVPLPCSTKALSPWLEANGVEGDAELLVQHLRISRLVALAVAEGADRQRHCAIRLESHPRPFAWLPARGLDEVADADAAPLAPRRRLRPPRREAGPVREPQGHLLGLGEEAAVDLVAGGVGIGDLLGADVVAPADLVAADAERRGARVEQPLQHIGRLRPARAAVGVGRRGVGEDAAHLHVQRLDVVDGAVDAAARHGRDARAEILQVGAHRRDGAYPHPEHPAHPRRRPSRPGSRGRGHAGRRRRSRCGRSATSPGGRAALPPRAPCRSPGKACRAGRSRRRRPVRRRAACPSAPSGCAVPGHPAPGPRPGSASAGCSAPSPGRTHRWRRAVPSGCRPAGC